MSKANFFVVLILILTLLPTNQFAFAQDPVCPDGPSMSGNNISVGSLAHTTITTNLEQWGYAATIIATLPMNSDLQVLAGPCGNWPGFWQVQTQSGLIGWVSDYDLAAGASPSIITPNVSEDQILSCIDPSLLTPAENTLWERVKDLLGIRVYAAEELCHPQCVDYVRGQRPDSTSWAPRSSSTDPSTWTGASEWNDLAENNGSSFQLNGQTNNVHLREDLSTDPPQNGDIVVWEVDRSHPAGHVAILRSYDNTTGTITVDETNYDNNCSFHSASYTFDSSHMSIISSPEAGQRSTQQQATQPILTNQAIDRCTNRSLLRRLLDWLLRRPCR